MGWLFGDNSDQAQAAQQVQQGHQSSLSHELIAAAAAFEAQKAYARHCEQNGKPESHQVARELFAAFAAAEADKLIETKGLDFLDREEAKRQARQHAAETLKSVRHADRKLALWKPVHRHLCKNANPDACYLAPLSEKEENWLRSLADDSRAKIFRDQPDGEPTKQYLVRMAPGLQGGWEAYVARMTSRTSPELEPARSQALSTVRRQLNHLSFTASPNAPVDPVWHPWQELVLFHGTLVDPVTGVGRITGGGAGKRDPWRKFNALYRAVLVFCALTAPALALRTAPRVQGGPPPALSPVVTVANLDAAFARVQVEFGRAEMSPGVRATAQRAVAYLEAQLVDAKSELSLHEMEQQPGMEQVVRLMRVARATTR
ncbi:hypothetical protein JCM10207_005045 [Rhodosporidiobolus poonsookiae]